MATINDVLNVCRNELGYSRWTDPNTGTKYGRWMAEVTGEDWLGGNDVAYCVMFISYCFAKAGMNEGYLPSQNCDDVVSRARNYNQLVSKDDIQVGDLLIFDWGDGGILDHIAIVENVINSCTFQTIEGNTNGGQVARRTRYSSSVMYVVRPNYYDSGYTDKLVIDGVWGRETTRKLNKYFNRGDIRDVTSQNIYWRQKGTLNACAADSWQFTSEPCGDGLISALQTKIGNCEIDGICGRETVTALQKYLGTYVDGKLDYPSPCVMELQTRLNNDTF